MSENLDPARPAPEVFVTPQGATRQERRHGVVIPAEIGKSDSRKAAYLRLLGMRTNTPVERAVPRRGKKVKRRGALVDRDLEGPEA